MHFLLEAQHLDKVSFKFHECKYFDKVKQKNW